MADLSKEWSEDEETAMQARHEQIAFLWKFMY